MKIEIFSKEFAKRKNILVEDYSEYGGLYYKVEPYKVINLEKRKIFIVGYVDYYVMDGKKIREDEIADKDFEILNGINPEQIDDYIEGTYIILIFENDTVTILLDKFAKQDVFYYNNDDGFVISDSLDIFANNNLLKDIDQESLLNFFISYGNYSPKRHTMYKDIRRIGHREYLKIENGKLNIKALKKEIYEIEEYDETKLNEYHSILSDSIEYRSTKTGINWIYLSSGWDSTAILGYLREMYEAKNVKAIIGKMVYSKRSGVINQFEIDRATEIAKYYGIELFEVPFDFTDNKSADYFESLDNVFKSNNIVSYNTYNFSKLADFINKNAGKEDKVFSGEISDGVHNFGFSQYATILNHPDLNFREYADKMSSYLFGPSFYKSVKEGYFQKDVVYNYLKSRYPENSFTERTTDDKIELNLEFLSSFFFSKARIPFYDNMSNGLIKESAKEIFNNLKKDYLLQYAKLLNENNIYSILINLYNSFHWQGSTIKAISKPLENYGKDIKLPFWDRYLQEYLQKMPENFGRGLDFNNTKYPLKWVLKNKINYPIHLQKGPHSYLYDVNPGFSHLSETINASNVKENFKSKLNDKNLEKFSNDLFDTEYLSKISNKYKESVELAGPELNDLSSLVLFNTLID
ncbi:MAG: asparagine synthase-related protein [Ignavibacteriae bacterium]|nr:asparagine synthase-related protein [Ignavibacteriota bacterium]